MRMFGGRQGGSAFPRPPGSASSTGAPRGSGKGGGKVGFGSDDISRGKGASGGGGGSGVSISTVEKRIQECRAAVGQLNEMLKMDFSQDLSPMVDVLVGEVREEVSQLQQGGEVCISEGRFDLVEQISGFASELDDIQRRAEVWKSGGGGGGGGAGVGGPGRMDAMSDDERMARELAAQFEEEERAASTMGTPAASMRSHRSTQEEDDERLARELAAAEGHDMPAPEVPRTSGPSRGEDISSPVASQAAFTGVQALEQASDGSEVGRRKEKKKKKDRDDAWGGDNFGGTSDGGGFGSGWPGGSPVLDAGAGAGGFPVDFGTFGSSGGGWGDSGPPAFPPAASSSQPPGAFGEDGLSAQDFGAFGGGSNSAFPAESQPPTSMAFGSGDIEGFPAEGAAAPSNSFGGVPGATPAVDPGAFPDAAGADVHSLPPESPPMGLPTRAASRDSWGGSSGSGPRGWGPAAAGELLTMHIQRPFAEIADDVKGFTASFVRSVATAMGISERRIRVQAVRPG
mmetsp:Transcript_33968/g.94028  ORF Transcript_33968/g.94028 Transcript_33968/m.94028 type:complete len:513 (-) Transcript_33968:210-1748(-)